MASSGQWERLGRIFRSEGQRPWMMTHSQMPHVEPIEGSTVRIYFTCRDAENRSCIAWLVIDLSRPTELLDLASAPLMVPGPMGTFDDVGVMGSWMVRRDGRRWFYVIGWNVKNRVPMHLSIGLAIGPDGGEPVIDDRVPGPVFERNPANPYYVSCPCVLPDGSGGWLMWYLSGLPWAVRDGKPASRYTVWRACSPDGVNWTPDPEASLTFVHPGELAIARPCLLKDPDVWRMWHSYRGEDFGYRIGYAESRDGLSWTRRDDHLSLLPAGAGFDGDMTCYPYVFDHGGERWMVYCGDAFGQGGLGLARLAT
jgi:hypothetical protein